MLRGAAFNWSPPKRNRQLFAEKHLTIVSPDKECTTMCVGPSVRASLSCERTWMSSASSSSLVLPRLTEGGGGGGEWRRRRHAAKALSRFSRAGKEKVRKSPNTSHYMRQFIFCSNLNSDCSCGKLCFFRMMTATVANSIPPPEERRRYHAIEAKERRKRRGRRSQVARNITRNTRHRKFEGLRISRTI